jgi:hypothetical protein
MTASEHDGAHDQFAQGVPSSTERVVILCIEENKEVRKNQRQALNVTYKRNT